MLPIINYSERIPQNRRISELNQLAFLYQDINNEQTLMWSPYTTFEAKMTYFLTHVGLPLFERDGTQYNNDFIVKIYEVSTETWKPVGDPIGVGTASGSSLPYMGTAWYTWPESTWPWMKFTLETPCVVQKGHKYAVVLSYAGTGNVLVYWLTMQFSKASGDLFTPYHAIGYRQYEYIPGEQWFVDEWVVVPPETEQQWTTQKVMPYRVYGVSAFGDCVDSFEVDEEELVDAALVYSEEEFAQVFTAEESYVLEFVKIRVYRTGTLSDVTIAIKNAVNGLPVGADLTTGRLRASDANLLIDDVPGEWISVILEPSVHLTKGNTYAIVCRCPTSWPNTLGWMIVGDVPE